MTGRTHACPGNCGAQVFTHQFACRTDWYRLPLEIRRDITSNYRRDRAAHLEAMGDAMQWYTENPQEVASG